MNTPFKGLKALLTDDYESIRRVLGEDHQNLEPHFAADHTDHIGDRNIFAAKQPV